MTSDPKILKFINRRIFIILIGKSVLFTILISRLFYLQIIKGGQYIQSAQKNHLREIIQPVERGLILDSKGIVLARNSQQYMLMLDAKKITDIDLFFSKIDDIIEFDLEKKEEIIKLFNNKKKFIELKFIDLDRFLYLQYYLDNLPEIFIIRKTVRQYVYGETFAHIIGYVTNDIKKYENNYFIEAANFKIGRTGAEARYNENLTGENKVLQIEVDSKGKKIREMNSKGGKNGENFYSSLDFELQSFIWQEIKNNPATVVVSSLADSTKIIACCSSPSFNPEIFNNEEINQNSWKELMNDPARPLINKTISGIYSPGSTYKIVVALTALQLGMINETSRIFCNGGYQIGSRIYHCLHQHGYINVIEAIEKSCNCFFYALAQNMDIDFLREVSLSFGLGKISALNLPGEISGVLPSKAWKFKRFADKWRAGDSANLMIGQGYLSCTPLQINSMVASIATGKIINFSLNQNEKTLCEKNQLISEKNFNIVRYGMNRVVNMKNGGTSYNSIGSKYPELAICGKTGTVQTSSNKTTKNHSMFVGFAPFKEPQYAVSIVGEYAGYGAQFAAPLAGKIFNFLLTL